MCINVIIAQQNVGDHEKQRLKHCYNDGSGCLSAVHMVHGPQMQSLNMEVGSSCVSGDPASSSSVVQVCFPSAQAAVLNSLNRQREDGRLCDLSIHVQGQVFKAHRCVLAASSPYFHDQVGTLR